MVESEIGRTQSGSPTRQFVVIGGREFLCDAEGFLWNPEDWSREVAEDLAGKDNQVLTETHWRVLNFLRDYFMYNGRAPLNRQLAKGTGLSLLQIEELFPGGIKYGARRLAGLPNPKTCS
jgi:tRNA 2-thiouridine synthesizing protein E